MDVRVKGWGVGDHGRLGTGTMSSEVDPATVAFPLDVDEIVQLVAGGCHSLGLDVSGQVFAWGSNEYGQLGLGKDNKQSHRGVSTNTCVPTKLPWFGTPDVHDIDTPIMGVCASLSAGWGHCAAVTDDGRLFMWGDGRQGQLGNRVWESCDPPVPVECGGSSTSTKPISTSLGFTEVVSASCGLHHTIALTAAGDVFVTGRGREGQLGLGAEQVKGNINRFSKVSLKYPMQAVSAGRNFCVGLSRGGARLAAWGDNCHLQLGVDGEYIRSTPVYITPTIPRLGAVNIKAVACGDYHTVVVSDAGMCMGWGRQREGQLGTVAVKDVSTPTMLKESNVEMVSCGSLSTALVSVDQKLLICGKLNLRKLKLSKFTQLTCDVHGVAVGNSHILAAASEYQADPSYRGEANLKVYASGEADVINRLCDDMKSMRPQLNAKLQQLTRVTRYCVVAPSQLEGMVASTATRKQRAIENADIVQKEIDILSTLKPQQLSHGEGDRELQERNAELESREEYHVQRVEEMEKLLAEALAANRQLRGKMEDNEKEMCTQKELLDRYDRELQVVKDMSQELQSHCENLKKEFLETQNTVVTLRGENNNLKSRNHTLKSALHDMETERDMLVHEMNLSRKKQASSAFGAPNDGPAAAFGDETTETITASAVDETDE